MGNSFTLAAGQREAGFSLAELMIVVAIIGILAALAVPQFQRFEAKAKQSEAKSNLSHIYTLQQTYYGENDDFCNDGGWVQTITCIGFSADVHARYYYATASTPGYFLAGAYAHSNDAIRANCNQMDNWWIDSTKNIWTTQDCSISP